MLFNVEKPYSSTRAAFQSTSNRSHSNFPFLKQTPSQPGPFPDSCVCGRHVPRGQIRLWLAAASPGIFRRFHLDRTNITAPPFVWAASNYRHGSEQLAKRADWATGRPPGRAATERLTRWLGSDSRPLLGRVPAPGGLDRHGPPGPPRTSQHSAARRGGWSPLDPTLHSTPEVMSAQRRGRHSGAAIRPFTTRLWREWRA